MSVPELDPSFIPMSELMVIPEPVAELAPTPKPKSVPEIVSEPSQQNLDPIIDKSKTVEKSLISLF